MISLSLPSNIFYADLFINVKQTFGDVKNPVKMIMNYCFSVLENMLQTSKMNLAGVQSCENTHTLLLIIHQDSQTTAHASHFYQTH